MPAPKRDGARRRVHVGAEAMEALELLQVVSAERTGGDALASPAVAAALQAIADPKPNAAVRTAYEGRLRALRDDIQRMLASKAPSADDFEAHDARLHPAARDLVELALESPLRVTVVGSFLLGLSVDHADVAIHAPEAYFGDRDVANYKYHRKRLVLLEHLRRHLAALGWAAEWSHPHGACKPVLAVRHPEAADVQLRVHVSHATDIFPAHALAPDRRNVRAKGESPVVTDATLATPAYNAAILADAALIPALRALHAAHNAAPSFVGAVRLLRAFITRRALGSGTFVAAALLADLVAKRAAPPTAPPPTLLRAALVAMRSGALEKLVLVGVPVCAARDAAWHWRVRQEAACALRIIDAEAAVLDPWRGALPALFFTARGAQCRSVSLATLFDAFVRCKGDVDAHALRGVLCEALVSTGRARSVEVLDDALLGVQLAGFNEACRKVDTCAAKDNEAAFKRFWGDKVSMRRFQQGGIKAAVVWDGGRDTLQHIVSYAVKRHLPAAAAAAVRVLYAQLDAAAALQGPEADAELEAEALTLRITRALESLGKNLRALEGLPLRVTSLTGVSPHLRRSAVRPPRPHPRGRYIDAVECVAEFESTKQWPEDAVALSAAKAGFYVALHEALKDKGVTSQATVSYVDAMLGGFVFRIRLRADGEEESYPAGSPDRAELVWQTRGRLEVHSALRGADTLCARVSRVAKRWLAVHMLYDTLGPRSAELVELLVLKALQGPHPRAPTSVLSGFARLLDLVAHYPWEAWPVVVDSPTKVDTNPYDDDDKEQSEDPMRDDRDLQHLKSAIESFERRKKPPALAVAFPCADAESWYGASPPAAVAGRLVATASAALQHLEAVIRGERPMRSLRSLFRTPVDGVYQLRLEVADGAAIQGDAARYAKRPVMTLDSSRVAHNPVDMMHAVLEEELGDYAWFARDCFADDSLYVAWKETALRPRPFTVRGMRYAAPSADGEGLVPDRAAMVDEMRRLTNGGLNRIVKLTADEALADVEQER